MYRENADELVSLSQKVQALKGLRSQRHAVASHLAFVQQQLEQAGQRVDQERGEVEALKESSFDRLFARLRGQLEDRLEQEQADVAQAEMQYTHLAQQVDAAAETLRGIDAQIEALGPVEQQHTEAFQRRVNEIIAGDDARAESIGNLIRRVEAAQAYEFELGQAAQAGHNTLKLVDDALAFLGVRTRPEHADWPTINDLVPGPGLSRALAAVQRLKLMLVQYQAELQDINEHLDVPVQLDMFVYVARAELGRYEGRNYYSVASMGRTDLQSLRAQLLTAMQRVQQQHEAHQQHLQAQWARLRIRGRARVLRPCDLRFCSE